MIPVTANSSVGLHEPPSAATVAPLRAERSRFSSGGRLATLGLVLVPAAVYLLVRGIGVLVLASIVAARGVPLAPELRSWDGEWLLGIAAGGYADLPAGLVDAFGHRDPTTGLAFFPG